MRVALRLAGSCLCVTTLRFCRQFAAVMALIPFALPAVEGATIVGPTHSSRVDGTTSSIAGGYLYEFEVFNTTPSQTTTSLIVDWELPLFSLDDINAASIQSPTDWTYEILTSWVYDTSNDPVLAGNPGLYGPNPEAFETAPYILHWYTSVTTPPAAIAAGASLAGFSFESAYASQNAPYLTSWIELPPVTGDPPTPGGNAAFGTPNSPARQGGPVVPEPTSLAMLLGLGFGGLVTRVVRRRGAGHS